MKSAHVIKKNLKGFSWASFYVQKTKRVDRKYFSDRHVHQHHEFIQMHDVITLCVTS